MHSDELIIMKRMVGREFEASDSKSLTSTWLPGEQCCMNIAIGELWNSCVMNSG